MRSEKSVKRGSGRKRVDRRAECAIWEAQAGRSGDMNLKELQQLASEYIKWHYEKTKAESHLKVLREKLSKAVGVSVKVGKNELKVAEFKRTIKVFDEDAFVRSLKERFSQSEVDEILKIYENSKKKKMTETFRIFVN